MKYSYRYLLLAVCLLVGLGAFSGYAQATELPPLETVPKIKASDLCPDLMKGYQEQLLLTLFNGESLEEMGMEFNLWIAKMDGEPAELFQETNWPANTEESYSESSAGMMIGMLTAFFDKLLLEAWGDEWLELAKQKAGEYADVMIQQQTYTIDVSEFEHYSVQVTSPYLDVKTMEIHEGTYVFITEISISPEMAMKYMELAGEELEEMVTSDQVSVEHVLGDWSVETDDQSISVTISKYLGTRQEDGVVYDFYAGDIDIFDQNLTVDRIPDYVYGEEGFILVERSEGYCTLDIYVEGADSYFSLTSEIDSLGDILEAYVSYGNADEYYESEDLDELVR